MQLPPKFHSVMHPTKRDYINISQQSASEFHNFVLKHLRYQSSEALETCVLCHITILSIVRYSGLQEYYR